ncbi:MAG: class I SAM-dependent methyltransferase [Bacteroidota bacterium]|nr:class I SAM-dependent methyltransferase [Bacteroidota bacterium]
MEKLILCPVCKEDLLKRFLSCKDYVASGEDFSLDQCNNCGFVFTNPRPDFNECGRYYESDKYVSHQDNDKSFVLYLYRWVRNRNLKWKLKVISKYQKITGEILDYGCGLGNFLNFCKQQGWKSTGMDVSENARNVVKERYDINVFPNAEIKNQGNNKYDIITLWHVLEHVYDIDETVLEFHRILKDSGTLFIAVPNRKSYDALHYKEKWDAYDVPRHIYHFSPEDMGVLMNRLGFKIVEKRGMFYDAFYVSMRSEMHNGRGMKILRGFYRGLISNIKAAGNHKYSSMLYVIKKK